MKIVTRNDVIEAIANSGADGITARDLAETLGTTEPRIRTHVSRLCRDNMISKKRRALSGRHWEAVYYSNTTDKEPVEQPVNVRIDDPAPEVSKHKPNQNHEGYNDPTATEAIKRMERHGGFMPGGIYKTTNGEAFLVLTTYPDTILGYRIDFVPKATDTDSEVTWKVGANSALVHTHRVCSIPFKRLLLGNMTKCPFESFRDILRKSPFNSCKKVEVPVEGADHTEELELCHSKIEELTARNVEATKIMDDTQQTLNTIRTEYEVLRNLHTELVSKYDSMRHDICDLVREAEESIGRKISSVSELVDVLKEYKDLAEAPIDKDASGVSVADYERLKGERDVYKSIVDRVVDYWAS